jgi:F0F1-type ATP synthase epsilon subunit
MSCTIVSPQKTTQYFDLENLVLPAFLGEMQVLPGHAEAFILLKKGKIIFNADSDSKTMLEIAEGECHIKDDKIIIIL